MGLNGALGLGFIFTAKNLASGTIRGITKDFGNLDKASTKASRGFGVAIASMAAGAVGLGLGLGILAASAKAANLSGNFTQQMAAASQIMRASKEDMAALREEVIATGIATKFSPDEIVEGVKNLGAAGLTAGENLKTIRPSALLATAGQISLDEASRAVVGTLKAFQLEAAQAGEVADKLTRITQQTNFQAKDFEVGLSRVAGVAGVFGQKLDSVLVLMGALRNMNIEASVASTSVREAIRRLSSNAKVQNKVLALGVALYDKQTGAMRNMNDIIFDLDRSLSGVTKKQRDQTLTQLFGARGILAFGGAVNATKKVMRDGVEVTLRGAEAFSEMMKQQAGAAGTTETFNRVLQSNFKGQKDIMIGILQTMLMLVGTGFEGALLPVLNTLNDLLRVTTSLLGNIPAPVKTAAAAFIIGTGALIAATGAATLLIGALVLLKVMFFAIAGPMVIATGVVVVMGTSLLALGATIGTVAFTAKRNFGDIGSSIKNMWVSSKLFLTALKEALFEGGIKGDTLVELMGEQNKGLRKKLGRTVQLFFRAQRFIEGVFDSFKQTLKANEVVFDSLRVAAKGLFEALGLGVTDMDLLTSSSNNSANAGKEWGRKFGAAALLLITGLTAAVGFMEDVVTASKSIDEAARNTRDVLILLTAAYGGVKLVMIAMNTQLFIATGRTKALAVWSALQAGITWGLAAATTAYSLALKAYAIVAFAATAPTSLLAIAFSTLAGPLLLVVGALAAGVGFGVWIDGWLGISDAISKAAFNLFNFNDELDALPDVYKGDSISRDQRNAPAVQGGGTLPSNAALAAGTTTAIQNAAASQGGIVSSTDDKGVGATRDALNALLQQTGNGANKSVVNINMDSATIARMLREAAGKQNVETFGGGGFSEP